MSTAIRLEHVSKKFTLHHRRARSFQELIIGLFQGERTTPSPERSGASTGFKKEPREEFWALRDVSFSVDEGETVGIIGPNGSGKSTVLKLISRIIEPSSGDIEVNGRVGALLELGAGFHPDLTGRENIYLNGSILGLSRTDIHSRIDRIIAFAELERFIDMPVRQYSSGMYVRLGFSVAVHTKPEILLVDEVLAVGDEAFQRKCLDKIHAMREANTTILLVSHGIESITRLCHRAIWLEEGQLVHDGAGRDVAEAYLVSVNKRDRERLETEEIRSFPSHVTAKQAKTGGRSGSGDIRIIDVAFLDERGNSADVFLSGQRMTVRLTYQARQRIENPVFGLGIHRDDNIHIAGPNTRASGYRVSAVRGKGVLDFVIPELPLTAGRYHVSVSAYDETISHKYDYRHRAFSFVVQPQSAWDTIGVTRLPGHWRRQDGEVTPHDRDI